MARRVIHECDLTKQEFDPANEKVFVLTIAIKGKKAPMKYELSASAAEQLLAQLNGSRQLKEGWNFSSPGDAQLTRPKVRGEDEPRPRTLGDLEDDPDDIGQHDETDERFVREKKAKLREAGVLPEEDEEREPAIGKVLDANRDNCMHINKGAIQTTLRKGKRHIFRQCKECGRNVPEMSSADRKGYMGGKLPADVRIRDLD